MTSKSIYFSALIFLSQMINSQVKTTNINYVWAAKEFSKDVAQFRAKSFLYRNILGVSENIAKFELIPLAAASSGELTTLLYKAADKNKEGLLLGFFGDYWNDSGATFQGYAFKNLDKEEAYEFLNKISDAIEENDKYLRENSDNNNIYTSYKDIDIIIFGGGQNIRLFWNNFDSSWEKTAFERSKRRFERKTK